jgi:hypothetical protein
MPIKTSSAKAKGRELQKHVRDQIMAKFPWLKEGDVDSRPMGSGGVDIMMANVARRTFPVSIEAKKTKKLPSQAEMNQAKANKYDGTIAAVIWAGHGQGPSKAKIIMEFEDFLNWYKEVAEERLNKIEREQGALS